MRGVQHGPVHHQAQRGHLGGLRAQAQQRQLRFGQDSGADLQDERHHHIAGDVGQDVRQHDAHQAVAGELGEVHVVAVAQRDDLGAHRTGGPRPAGQTDDHGHHGGAAVLLADGIVDEDQQHEAGDDGEDVGDEHDEVVHKAADVAGQKAQQQADERGDAAGDEADLQRGADGGYQLLEHVAAEVVGAQRQVDDVGHVADLHVIGGLDLGAGLRLTGFAGGCHGELFGRVGGEDGVVQALVVVALRLGHACGLGRFIVVLLPHGQQLVGVGDVQAGDVDFHGGEPVDHGHAVLVGQHLGQAVGVGVGQLEGGGLGADGVIEGNIGAGLLEGAQADHLQRIAGIDQRIDDRRQQDDDEQAKADHEFRGMKDLANGVFHAVPPPLSRTARP